MTDAEHIEWNEQSALLVRGHDPTDDEAREMAATEFGCQADEVHILRGWFRKRPALPHEPVAYDHVIQHQDTPGRGAFPAVLVGFDVDG